MVRLWQVGSERGNVRLWDVSEGTLRNTLEGHAGDVNSVSFSPDGQIVGKWGVR